MRVYLISILIIAIAGCSSSKKKPAQQVESEPQLEVQENNDVPQEQTSATEKTESELWQAYNEADLPDLERRISPSTFTLYRCEYSSLLFSLRSSNVELELPTQQGVQTFFLENSNTMSEELAAKYPEIKSYKGKSSDGKLTIRLDANAEGLFAEISGEQTKQLLSPLLKGNRFFYALCNEDALPKSPRDETFD